MKESESESKTKIFRQNSLLERERCVCVGLFG